MEITSDTLNNLLINLQVALSNNDMSNFIQKVVNYNFYTTLVGIVFFNLLFLGITIICKIYVEKKKKKEQIEKAYMLEGFAWCIYVIMWVSFAFFVLALIVSIIGSVHLYTCIVFPEKAFLDYILGSI